MPSTQVSKTIICQDINGDGLPDRVTFEPYHLDQAFKVEINHNGAVRPEKDLPRLTVALNGQKGQRSYYVNWSLGKDEKGRPSEERITGFRFAVIPKGPVEQLNAKGATLTEIAIALTVLTEKGEHLMADQLMGVGMAVYLRREGGWEYYTLVTAEEAGRLRAQKVARN